MMSQAAEALAKDAIPHGAERVVARAILKDAVFYGAGEQTRRAPCGEYAIAHHDGRVGFRSCVGRVGFALSLDAFLQHIYEGRIALVERRAAA